MELNELVMQAKKGSAEAFGRLYSFYYKEMYYYAFSRVRNENDACDIVSEAVLDAFSSIKKLRKAENFKSWIFTILTRKITKKYSEKQVNTLSIDDSESEFNEIPFNQDITKIEAEEILNTLSEKEREIFSLCYVCGFTSDEVSKITDTNPSTVRSHLLRAKNKLKKLYSDSGI